MNCNAFSGAQGALPLVLYENIQTGTDRGDPARLHCCLRVAGAGADPLHHRTAVLPAFHQEAPVHPSPHSACSLGQEHLMGMFTRAGVAARGGEPDASRRRRRSASSRTHGVCAWFSGRLVLESVSLIMERSRVTALIGPSGCGKSTYLRILNRMHELVPGAQLAGRVELDGVDIYGGGLRATEARKHIGMVFQKPNPFPAMTIEENVLSGLKFSRTKLSGAGKRLAGRGDADQSRLVERGQGPARTSWAAASPEGSSSGCASPELWPCGPGFCSWTSPARRSTPRRRIGSRRRFATSLMRSPSSSSPTTCSKPNGCRNTCAFFLAAEGQPGRVIEFGDTEMMFGNPSDPRTSDYVHGRFG